MQFGNVTCDAEEKDNGARFEIVVPESSGGRWALRHSGRGYFLGAATDKLVCSAKTPAESEFWYATKQNVAFISISFDVKLPFKVFPFNKRRLHKLKRLSSRLLSLGA